MAASLDCLKCGLVSTPIVEKCAFCGATLQDPAKAAAAKAEHDALPAKVREEFEKEYARREETFREYRRWLRKYRNFHVLSGAIAFGILAPIIIPPSNFGAIANFVIGGVAAWELNRRRGGRMTGILLAALAIVASGAASFDGLWNALARGGGFGPAFSGGAVLVTVTSAGFLGEKLNWGYFERQFFY